MAMVEGAYLRDKNTWTENVGGGAYTRRGAYMRDATVCSSFVLSSKSLITLDDRLEAFIIILEQMDIWTD